MCIASSFDRSEDRGRNTQLLNIRIVYIPFRSLLFPVVVTLARSREGEASPRRAGLVYRICLDEVE